MVHGRALTVTDEWLGEDKLWHFLWCFALTILFYVVLLALHHWNILQRCCCYCYCDGGRSNCQQTSHTHPNVQWIILFVAGGLSLMVGGIKELGDALDIWPYICPCHASGKDFLADLIGVLLGCACILLLNTLCLNNKHKLYCCWVDRSADLDHPELPPENKDEVRSPSTQEEQKQELSETV